MHPVHRLALAEDDQRARTPPAGGLACSEVEARQDGDPDGDRAGSGYCPLCGEEHDCPDDEDYCAPTEYTAYGRNGFEYH